MKKGMSLEQHRQTGLKLQVIHDQLQKVAVLVTGCYPAKHHISRAASVFYGGPGSPAYDLRSTLDNIACREYPGQDATKAYFQGGLPGYECPEHLPGLNTRTAELFSQIKRTREQSTKRKPLFSTFEIICLCRALHCLGSETATVGMGVAWAYFPADDLAGQTKNLLDVIKKLALLLLDELPPALCADAANSKEWGIK